MASNDLNRLDLFAWLPDFSLATADSKVVDTREYRSLDALVVAFISNTSPACQRIHSAFGTLAWEFRVRGAAFLVVNPLAGRGPGESGPAMQRIAKTSGWAMPYLLDPDQKVARAFGVQRVPDFFVFNRNRRLAYHGRFDAEVSEDDPTGDDLREGLESILRHEPPVIGRPSSGDLLWSRTGTGTEGTPSSEAGESSAR